MSDWDRLSDIAEKVNSGQKRAVDLVDQAFNNLHDKAEYQTVISLTKDRALKRAKEIDERVKSGKSAGRLAGVPFIAKDNFLVFGAETTAASNILKGFEAPYQATAVNKLEEQGAICVAKANMDAFGHGASTENSDFFVTKNPYDESRVAGGSSGGSAASVALQVVPFSIGTDTGGSIRTPSSFCGTVGYKPTYGLVSRSGVVAMASSTDTIGAMANNVSDCSLVLELMAGQDELDGTTITAPEPEFSKLNNKTSRPKIGLIKEYFDQGLQPGVKQCLDKAIAKLKDAGAEISEVSLPSLSLALAVYYILCPAEISSNLSRYDGQRFGFSDKSADNMEASYIKSRSRGFGKEAKRRIMIGTYVLSSGYYDAYYKQAQKVRTKIVDEFNSRLKDYDFLVGPTISTTAFKIGEKSNNPLTMYLNDILTVAANLTGMPAINLPVGQSDGLPVGLQIIAGQKQDNKLLSYAKQVEDILKSE